MIRTIWGDPERFKKSYYPDDFKGKLLPGAGDGADPRRAKTGYFTITGRIDDVLNVSGHRMGTMEIESALVATPSWWPRPPWWAARTTPPARAICAFVVLKRPRPTGDEAKKIANELRNWVGKEIGPIAKPKDIRLATTCPRPARQDHAGRRCRAAAPRSCRWRSTASSQAGTPLRFEQAAADDGAVRAGLHFDRRLRIAADRIGEHDVGQDARLMRPA